MSINKKPVNRRVFIITALEIANELEMNSHIKL